MKRTTRVIALVIVVAGLAGSGMAAFWPRVPVDATLTDPEAPPARLVCYGYVDSWQGSLLLQPARAGRVARVFVTQGQTVCKDAPLVQLDDRLVNLQEHDAELAVETAQLQLAKARDGVKQYRARRAEAEAAVRAAQAKSVAAQHSVAIEKRLLDTTSYGNKDRLGVAQAQLDGANALVEVEQNRLAEFQAVDPEVEVKLAQLQADRSYTQFERSRQEREEYLLRAPVDGTVLRVQAQEGDLVGPTSPRPAVWLGPAGEWIVRAEVSQEFAGRVRKGLVVQVEDEESAGALAEGRIVEVSDWFLPRRQISTQPTGINTGLTVECLIDLHDGHAPLRLGQRVRVRILAEQSSGGIDASSKSPSTQAEVAGKSNE